MVQSDVTRYIATFILYGCSLAAEARTYPLNAESPDVVGHSQSVKSVSNETLTDLALRHRVGIDVLVAANAHIEGSLTAPLPIGTSITLPQQHVLPDIEQVGIVINLPELRLYYFPPDEQEVRVYPVGVGRSGWSTPELKSTLSEKRHKPAWSPPASIRAEAAASGINLPAFFPPGPDNPLGEYALRIGSTDFLIHGTNNPAGVGMRVSHGCIRMYSEDIKELAQLVSLGTPVAIINQPTKWGALGNSSLLEAHHPILEPKTKVRARLAQGFEKAERLAGPETRRILEDHAAALLGQNKLFNGLPHTIPDASSDRLN